MLCCPQNAVISALPKIVTAGFKAVNLIYYFTAGVVEVGGWVGACPWQLARPRSVVVAVEVGVGVGGSEAGCREGGPQQQRICLSCPVWYPTNGPLPPASSACGAPN